MVIDRYFDLSNERRRRLNKASRIGKKFLSTFCKVAAFIATAVGVLWFMFWTMTAAGTAFGSSAGLGVMLIWIAAFIAAIFTIQE